MNFSKAHGPRGSLERRFRDETDMANLLRLAGRHRTIILKTHPYCDQILGTDAFRTARRYGTFMGLLEGNRRRPSAILTGNVRGSLVIPKGYRTFNGHVLPVIDAREAGRISVTGQLVMAEDEGRTTLIKMYSQRTSWKQCVGEHMAYVLAENEFFRALSETEGVPTFILMHPKLTGIFWEICEQKGFRLAGRLDVHVVDSFSGEIRESWREQFVDASAGAKAILSVGGHINACLSGTRDSIKDIFGERGLDQPIFENARLIYSTC